MAIIEIGDADIAYNGPALPEGVDANDPMTVAAFAIHASEVIALPPVPGAAVEAL
jgi:hypothetical protein